MTGPAVAAEQAAESVRMVNHLTLAAPSEATPGWEGVGDLYRVLGELHILAERLPQACGQLARHLERPATGCTFQADAMTDELAAVVVATAVLALDEARHDAGQVSAHLNEALSAVAHLRT